MTGEDKSKPGLVRSQPSALSRAGTAALARRGMQDLLTRGDADQWYRRGLGLWDQDMYKEAVECFQRGIALNPNHPGLHYYLGFAYCRGLGVSQDYGEAATWWRKAADQGSAMARSALGLMYLELRDYTRASVWYRMAAELGDALASSELGPLFEIGPPGVQFDYDHVAAYYCRVAERGRDGSVWDESAWQALREISLNLLLAGVYYQWVALGGERGRQAQQDLDRMTTKLPNQDASRVYFACGWMHQHGRGVLQDCTRAAWWFRLAAAQGHERAQQALDDMLSEARGVEHE